MFHLVKFSYIVVVQQKGGKANYDDGSALNNEGMNVDRSASEASFSRFSLHHQIKISYG